MKKRFAFGNQSGAAGALLALSLALPRRDGQVETPPGDLGAARPAAGADLARRGDDVARDDGDVLVSERAQHGQAGVVGEAELGIAGVLLDVLADVGHAGHILQELRVGAGHIHSHLLDEVVLRLRAATPADRLRRGVAHFFARGTVLDAQGDVKELNQAALGVAPSAVLPIRVAARAVVVDDAEWQAGFGHVLAPGEERPDAVVEDDGITALVHPLQDVRQVGQALGKSPQAARNGRRVVASRGRDGREHEGDDGRAAGFDGHGDEVEPRFVHRSGKGQERGQVLEAVDVLVHEERLEVPQTNGRIRRHRRNLQAARDVQQRNRDLGRQPVRGRIAAPDVAVSHEA
ncbi:hypothetical protein Trco_004727 [Trichoderma cornu-damae]|uniref:Uncharacterized protein n=1 Tax=Trichoderma cornu-damae TaxID=654480 RepID=A0A9P8TVT0_9HYPO|nr:hypothetical protein Trco_004727 [Trichoderma cornu-damae]